MLFSDMIMRSFSLELARTRKDFLAALSTGPPSAMDVHAVDRAIEETGESLRRAMLDQANRALLGAASREGATNVPQVLTKTHATVPHDHHHHQQQQQQQHQLPDPEYDEGVAEGVFALLGRLAGSGQRSLYGRLVTSAAGLFTQMARGHNVVNETRLHESLYRLDVVASDAARRSIMRVLDPANCFFGAFDCTEFVRRVHPHVVTAQESALHPPQRVTEAVPKPKPWGPKNACPRSMRSANCHAREASHPHNTAPRWLSGSHRGRTTPRKSALDTGQNRVPLGEGAARQRPRESTEPEAHGGAVADGLEELVNTVVANVRQRVELAMNSSTNHEHQ